MGEEEHRSSVLAVIPVGGESALPLCRWRTREPSFTNKGRGWLRGTVQPGTSCAR